MYTTMQLREKILQALEQNAVKTTKLASDFSVSRAYVHRILRELQDEGLVRMIGQKRHAHYILVKDLGAIKKALREVRSISLTLSNTGLDEAGVYRRIEAETGILDGVGANVQRIVEFAFTEMLNNAIDHSKSPTISVSCRRTDSVITFLVRDFGIGIFNNVKEKFHLPNTLAAIQDILKGKTTTDPTRHSGQGVFFTSRAADTFIVDSYDKRLTVNNLLPDVFITERKSLKGTRVSFSVHVDSKKRLKEDVFDPYILDREEFTFDKTNVIVKLYQFGTNLPSRSEAKRVTVNLEHFRVAELDFNGVATIGQGFADEIFRVWQNRHQDTELICTNASMIVADMIHRAGGKCKPTA